MSIGEAMDDASNASGAARCGGAREALIIALLAYGLTQCGEAFAADQPANFVKDIQPLVGGRPLPMAFVPTARPVSEPEHPMMDFSRRDVEARDAQPSADAERSLQPQSFESGSVWQRLADYRVQGRVQLLTLWESSRNMVSLQAGKHGGPSLQWSSRVMNHGGATRGVFDRFVESSLGAARVGYKAAAHGSSATANIRPVVSPQAVKLP